MSNAIRLILELVLEALLETLFLELIDPLYCLNIA